MLSPTLPRMPSELPAPKVVLLAEEDEHTRETLAADLRARGYSVVTLEDGLALCDYLERAHFSHGTVPCPDLILSEAKLPGYDGLDICRLIHREKGSVPFIVLAPYEDAETWEGAERAGACHVLNKPVDLSELHLAVASYLEDP